MLVAAIFCVCYLLAMYIIYCNTINQVRSIDDPRAKVFTENHISLRCYSRNHILVSLFFRALIIAIFVFLFSQVMIAMIIVEIAQGAYTVYFLTAVRYKKKRYLVVNLISNLLVMVQVLIAGFSALSLDQNYSGLNSLQKAWMAISFCSLVCLCLILVI